MVSVSLLNRARGRLSVVLSSALALSVVAVVPAAQASATLPPPFGYTITVAPTQVFEGTPTTVVATVTANVSLLGSVRVALPPSWTLTAPFTATAKSGNNTWSVTQHVCTSTDPAPCTGTGSVVVQADGGSHVIFLSQQLTISFNATPPSGAGALKSYAWNSAGRSGSGFIGLSFAPKLPTPTTTVVVGAASYFAVSAPATATAGTAVNATVTAYDAYNNVATGYAGTVHVTSSDGNSVLPADATLTSGTGTFSVTFKTTGTQTVTATDTATTSITGTSGPVTVNAAGATLLTLTGLTTTSAGTPLSLVLTAQDPFGNIATGYSGSVTFLCSAPVNTPTSSTGFCPAPITSFTGGHTTVPAQLDAAVSQSITASSGTLTSGTYSVTVAAAAPATIIIDSVTDTSTSPPLPQPVVTKAFNTAVHFIDTYGNLASLPTGATLSITKLVGTGTLTPGGPVTLISPQSSVVISGSTYSKIENGVGLQVSGGGLAPGNVTVDVATQAASATVTATIPKTLVSVDPTTGTTCVLSASNPTCSQFVLGNGGTGSAFLYEGSCSGFLACLSNTSGSALLVTGIANLNGLYSPTRPAQLVVSCYQSLCPRLNNERNQFPQWELEDLSEIVTAYPLSVTVDLPGGGTFTSDAKICHTSGVVDSGLLFCIDPTGSGTNAAGNFVQVLNFYQDIHAGNH